MARKLRNARQFLDLARPENFCLLTKTKKELRQAPSIFQVILLGTTNMLE